MQNKARSKPSPGAVYRYVSPAPLSEPVERESKEQQGEAARQSRTRIMPTRVASAQQSSVFLLAADATASSGTGGLTPQCNIAFASIPLCTSSSQLFALQGNCPSGQDSRRRVIPKAVAPTLRQPQLSSTGYCPGASAVLGSPVSQESGSGSTFWAAPPQSVLRLEDGQNAENDARARSPPPSSVESVSSRRCSHLLHHVLAAEKTKQYSMQIAAKARCLCCASRKGWAF